MRKGAAGQGVLDPWHKQRCTLAPPSPISSPIVIDSAFGSHALHQASLVKRRARCVVKTRTRSRHRGLSTTDTGSSTCMSRPCDSRHAHLPACPPARLPAPSSLRRETSLPKPSPALELDRSQHSRAETHCRGSTRNRRLYPCVRSCVSSPLLHTMHSLTRTGPRRRHRPKRRKWPRGGDGVSSARYNGT